MAVAGGKESDQTACAMSSPPSASNSCGRKSFRVSIIRVKPNSRNKRAVMQYWIPIVLWSVEKTYVRQNPAS